MNLKTLSLPVLILAAFAFLMATTSSADSVGPAQTPDKPVEQVRKNIQVLKGLPDSQLFLLMNFVGDSLGVSCDYCHVKGEKNPQTGEDTWIWEKDDKKEKLVGRQMMRMVLDLNQSQFKREAVVTCYTCHRGSTRPESMAPLPPRDIVKESLQSLHPQKRVLPTAEEIMAKYVSAVGVKQTSPFVMRGSVESRTNAGVVEVLFKQPNKCLIKQTNAQGLNTRATNGTTAWIQTPKGVTEITGDN